MEVTIGHHAEAIKLNALNINSYPIILGIDLLKKHNPTIHWNRHLVTFSSEYCALNCLSAANQAQTFPHHPRSSPSHGVIGQALAHVQVPAHAQVPEPSPVLSPTQILILNHVPIHALVPAQVSTTEVSSKLSTSETISSRYHEFLDVFSKEGADTLPPHIPYDHKIDLIPGTMPPSGRI